MKSNKGFYSVAGLSAVITLAIVLSGCSKSQPKIPRENRTQNQGQAPKPADDAAKKKKELEKKKKEEMEEDSPSDSADQPEPQLLQDLAVDFVGENLVLKVAKNGTYQGYVVFGLNVGQTVGPNEAFVLYALSHAKAVQYAANSVVEPLSRKFDAQDFSRAGVNALGITERAGPASNVWTYSFVLPFDYRTGVPTLQKNFDEVDQTEKEKRANGLNAKLRGPVPAEVGKLSFDLNNETVVIRLEGNDAKQLHAQLAQAPNSLIYCESEARCLVKLKYRNGEIVSAR